MLIRCRRCALNNDHHPRHSNRIVNLLTEQSLPSTVSVALFGEGRNYVSDRLRLIHLAGLRCARVRECERLYCAQSTRVMMSPWRWRDIAVFLFLLVIFTAIGSSLAIVSGTFLVRGVTTFEY